PWISSLVWNPWVTPTTRLFTSVRLMPHMAAARSMSLCGVTAMPSAPTRTSTSGTSVTLSSPLGPFTETVWPLTEAVTPFGSGTGFLPIRDMACSLEHLAEDFAADIGLTGVAVGHHALGRGDDRHAETLAMRLQILHRGVDPAARRRYALQFADHGLAFMIFEFDLDLALASLQLHLGVAADVALVLEHVEKTRAQARVRGLDLVQAAELAVPDAGQKIADGIRHRHVDSSPYQLALVMPGIWPKLARSRSAMRDSFSLR